MGWSNVFYNETNYVSIDRETSHLVNEDFSLHVSLPRIISAILILLLVIPATYKVGNSKMTFINVLVILDCLNAALHIPILLKTLKY